MPSSYTKTLQFTQQTLSKMLSELGGSEVLRQPPCSPDISPCDCDIPKLKESLRRRTICTDDTF